MKKYLESFLEWFFMLFLKKKALEIKKQAFEERKKAIIAYENKKYLSKISGRKKYVKTPTE